MSRKTSASRPLEERPQALAARRVTELAKGLGLDLADALAGDGEGLADLLEGVLATVADAEAHLEDHLLAGREGLQHLLRLFLEVELDDRVDRRRDVAVLDKIAEMRILLFADGRLEGD